MVSDKETTGLDEIDNKGELCYNYRDQSGNDYLVIQSLYAGRAAIAIHSASGILLKKMLHDIMGGQNILTLDLTGYAQGVYLLVIETDRFRKVIKINR